MKSVIIAFVTFMDSSDAVNVVCRMNCHRGWLDYDRSNECDTQHLHQPLLAVYSKPVATVGVTGFSRNVNCTLNVKICLYNMYVRHNDKPDSS